MATDSSWSASSVSLNSPPTTPVPQNLPTKRPSLSRNSSYSKYLTERPRAMASGLWDFCKYGPEVSDSKERLLSRVPAEPEKRHLPWRRWEGW
ncbi:hypothetical protein DBV05_g5720 [Lasiodiplodia theobromae]|uniref:Uncharacterized protein n=1 Tax=Lasiodiplodia theobromae TaxID=45133 RepID=A0A5N5DDZ8_9PEZI|nr:hypothetical protein DBV05_g5720 [Lasiodiplodia theobromae]